MRAKGYTKETINQIGVEKLKFPMFEVGDAVIVSTFIKEGEKVRVQDFEGDVIAIHNNGISSSFIVRKIGANAVSVERIFPLYSPVISNVKILKKGDIRRAKLFYIRDRVGKASRIKEKILTKQQKEQKFGEAV